MRGLYNADVGGECVDSKVLEKQQQQSFGNVSQMLGAMLLMTPGSTAADDEQKTFASALAAGGDK